MLCRDGDGRWSYAELAAALRFLGMTTTETKLCTGLLDADGSGTIELPELRAAINRHREDSELPLMDDSDAEKMADFTAPGLPSKVCRPGCSISFSTVYLLLLPCQPGVHDRVLHQRFLACGL